MKLIKVELNAEAHSEGSSSIVAKSVIEAWINPNFVAAVVTDSDDADDVCAFVSSYILLASGDRLHLAPQGGGAGAEAALLIDAIRECE